MFIIIWFLSSANSQQEAEAGEAEEVEESFY
jgi:hypothetical protein